MESNRVIKVCIADGHHLVREAMINLIKTFSRVKGVYGVVDGSTCKLNNYNSTDFGLNACILAGITLPDTRGTWPGAVATNRKTLVKILDK